MIRAVIFDCFGVLYVDCGLVFYQREVKNFAALRSEILDIDKQYDYGLIDEVAHDQAVAELTGLDYAFVHENVRGEHVINPELVEYSQSLRPRYKLGMLSNIGKGGMDSFFSQEQQAELFDAVVLSSDVGAIKPSKEIYEAMADKLGVAPHECVMIDDRQENVDGAIVAGMQAVLYATNQQCIRQLEQLLERMNA